MPFGRDGGGLAGRRDMLLGLGEVSLDLSGMIRRPGNSINQAFMQKLEPVKFRITKDILGDR